MIHHIENSTVFITDSGMYEPQHISWAIQRRRRTVRIVFGVLAILAVVTGALVAINNIYSH